MSHKRAKRERIADRRAGDKRVRGFMLNVLLSLQNQWRLALPAALKRFPNMKGPCRTCAIIPRTNDWQGMEATTLRLASALESCQPFYCHDGAPFDKEKGWLVDPETAPLCSAFAVLAGLNTGDPQKVVRQAVADAMGHPTAADTPEVIAAVEGLRGVLYAQEDARVERMVQNSAH